MQDFYDVLAFHEKFDLPRGLDPQPLDQDKLNFRLPFLFEELEEYEDAHQAGNLVGAADALFDLVYVAIGTTLFIGIPRSGVLGSWTSFGEVSGILRSHRMIGPREPRLLSQKMYQYQRNVLMGHILAFDRAHDAALGGELNAIELALGCMKKLAYEAYSTAYFMGIYWPRYWRHVQDANMKKMRAQADGSDSKRRTPWDVVKPSGWIAPDAAIANELLGAGWQMPVGMDINHVTGKVTLKEGA